MAGAIRFSSTYRRADWLAPLPVNRLNSMAMRKAISIHFMQPLAAFPAPSRPMPSFPRTCRIGCSASIPANSAEARAGAAAAAVDAAAVAAPVSGWKAEKPIAPPSPAKPAECSRFASIQPRARATPLPAEPSYKPPQLDRALTGGTPSADGKKLLFATNSHTVMIRKTASDYWVLDKSDNSWHKLGGKSAAGLMFAKFSPDGTARRLSRQGHPSGISMWKRSRPAP